MNAAALFNTADIIAVVFVLVCIALGLKRGLLGQIAPIVGLIVIAAAVRFGYAPCRDWLTTHLAANASVLCFAALVIVIGVPLAVMILLRKLLGKVVKLPFISGIDRLGGALAGLVFGTVFVFIVFFVLGGLPQRYRFPTVSEASWIGRHVALIEEDIVDVVSQKVDRTEGALLKARENRANRPKEWEQ